MNRIKGKQWTKSLIMDAAREAKSLAHEYAISLESGTSERDETEMLDRERLEIHQAEVRALVFAARMVSRHVRGGR